LDQRPMPLVPVTPKLVDAHIRSTMQEKDDFHHGCMLLVFGGCKRLRSAQRLCSWSATLWIPSAGCAFMLNSLARDLTRYTVAAQLPGDPAGISAVIKQC